MATERERQERERYIAWQEQFIKSVPPLTAHQKAVVAAAFRGA